ncbi:MAG: hypothetical protein JXR76_28945 [Deltaproteobacteria bacterium]|nr:hypothetical protein [Deltaproteobacteria bacterium]
MNCIRDSTQHDEISNHRAHKVSEDEIDFVEIGGIALGYNMMVSSSLEIIAQVTLDISQKSETVSAGAMIGFVAALPQNTAQ